MQAIKAIEAGAQRAPKSPFGDDNRSGAGFLIQNKVRQGLPQVSPGAGVLSWQF